MRRQTEHNIHILYALTFTYNLAVAIPTYINSTFLAAFIHEKAVGLIFTVGSLLSIVALAFIASVLRTFGNYVVTVLLAAVSTLALIGLVIFDVPAVIALSFVVYLIVINLLWYTTDLLLEHFSKDTTTGSIRGAYLSISNTAWVTAPLIAGFVLGADNYWRLYGLAALLFILLIPIMMRNFNHYRDPLYKRTPFWKTLLMMLKHRDLSKVFIVSFLLRLFYSWMVIYTPIYLHEHIGLGWSTIGIIFTIMLLPFALFEYPLGKLADRKLGEKEIMTVGFIIIAGTTAALTFITGTSIWLWGLVLFGTRTGASMVEVTSETYFFKKISDDDSELLGFFRMTSPLAYIIGPLLASLILIFIDIRFLFVTLGILMLWGLRYSTTLKDTL